jgi:hypothetical protein
VYVSADGGADTGPGNVVEEPLGWYEFDIFRGEVKEADAFFGGG